MTHDFIPTAKAQRGKGPRTKKAARKLRRLEPQQQAARPEKPDKRDRQESYGR
jgi:hypothetical protein